MRAPPIALTLFVLAAPACRSGGVTATSQVVESPSAQLEQLRTRWQAVEDLDHSQPSGSTPEAFVAAWKARDAEVDQICARIEPLLPVVPGALELYLDTYRYANHEVWFSARNRADLVLAGFVRDHADSPLLTEFLWRLWVGSSYSDEMRNHLLRVLSGSPFAAGSLARGWSRLAQLVAVHGIGGPAPWNHDARLAQRQLAELVEDSPGSPVGEQARELSRILELSSEPGPALAFELVDSNDTRIDLERSSGNVALIVYWDPRTDELRQLLEPLREYRGVDIFLPAIYSVAMGGPAGADMSGVRAAAFAEPAAARLPAEGLTHLPASFLLDSEGRLCGVDLFGVALRRRVHQLTSTAP
jgi:hypothetical protein